MMGTGGTTIQPRQYLRPQEVAELIGKSVSWIQRKAADGTLPHRKVGRDLRFVRSEVEAWVEGQR